MSLISRLSCSLGFFGVLYTRSHVRSSEWEPNGKSHEARKIGPPISKRHLKRFPDQKLPGNEDAL